MSGQAIFTAMLPEHFLLAGIVVLIGLEIAPSRPRGAFVVSLLAVTAATAAAVWLSFIGHASAPFPGQYSMDPIAALGLAGSASAEVLRGAGARSVEDRPRHRGGRPRRHRRGQEAA